MFDGALFGKEMADMVKSYVEAVASSLETRIKELEVQIAELKASAVTELPEQVSEETLRALILEQSKDLVSQIEIPQPSDGKDVDMDEVKALIGEAVRSEMDAIEFPTPTNGVDGKGIVDALIEADGTLTLTMTDGQVKRVGKVVGEDGKSAPAPAGISDVEINGSGELVFTMTDGTKSNVGKVVGEDGKTFDLDDFHIEMPDERTLTMSFQGGNQKHNFDVELPVPCYKGVFKEGAEYRKGDIVTWGGSAWHCNEHKSRRPAEADSGWTLMVKAGRNAKGG